MTAVAEALSGRNNLPVVGTILVDDNLAIPLVVGSLIYWLNGN
jgi:dolichol kinase